MAQRIGVITNDHTKVFQRSVIQGIIEIAEHEGYEVILDSRMEAQNPTLPTDLPLDNLAGVILIANVVPDEFARQIYHDGIPVSLISHRIADTPIPTVTTNNAQGITCLVDHLIQNCHRHRFVFINGDLHQIDGIERQTAFLQELVRHNLFVPPDYLLRGDFEPHIAAQSLTEFLQTPRQFDAIIAADFLMALQAIEVLTAHGYRVPEDVAVVGFGDGIESRQHQLTTIAADVVELGRRSTRQLFGQMKNLHIRGTTLLSVQLEIRQTCGYMA
jgi:DNA-binding LacI/PurR family transcriptional regulator